MRNVGLLDPIEIELVAQSKNNETTRDFTTEEAVNYQLKLLRTGSVIGPFTGDLRFRMANDVVGGDAFKRVRPPARGYMPSNFVEPMRVQINPSDTDTLNDWIGQSDLQVRSFERFNIDPEFSSTVSTRPFIYDNNSRLFSFEGDLYFLTEIYTVAALGQNQGNVKLFKWNEDEKIFELFKDFTEVPVDTNDNGAAYQFGSPDWVIVNGRINIVYRSLNRALERNFINVFEMTDDGTWTQKIQLSIEGTYDLTFTDFRLRAAYGDNSLMVVFCGLNNIQVTRGAGTVTIEKHDMRSFISFDDGYSFRSKSDNFAFIKKSKYSDYSIDTRVGNLAPFFVPIVGETVTAPELSFVDYTVKFDMYYDIDMGSFVIFKGGDPPNVWGGRSYLIGIKTTTQDYTEWEPCAKYLVDVSANADVEASPFDIDDETVTTPLTNSYRIEDVCVIPMEGKNVLLVQARTYLSAFGAPIGTTGTAICEFKFVNSAQIPPGNYDTLYAFGGKNHPQYSFVCSAINKDFAGITGISYHNSNTTGTEPIGCFHRNSIVCSEKKDVSGSEGYLALTTLKPWSNVGEDYGYQFAYDGYDTNYADFFTIAGVGSPTIAYSEAEFGVQITSPGATTAEFNLPAIAGQPNVIERASLYDFMFWKTTFTFRADQVDGDLTFLDAATSDGANGYGVELVWRTTDNIEINLGDGTNVTVTTEIFNREIFYQFLVGFGRDRQGAQVLFFYWREDGDMIWQTEGVYSVSEHATGATPYFKVGVVSVALSAGYDVYLRDVQVSNYGKQYRTVTSEQKTQNLLYYDGPSIYITDASLYDEPYYCGDIEVFGESFYLYDGSQIYVEGAQVDVKKDGVSWTYDRSISKNRPENTLSQTAQLGYDFTNEYTTGYGLFYSNPDNVDFEHVSLIGMVGIAEITVKSGTYDFNLGTWTNDDEQTIELGYDQLDYSSIVDEYIILDGITYPSDSLVGRTVMIFDILGSSWDQQLTVLRNFDDFVQFDQVVPSLAGKALFLMKEDETFTLTVPGVGDGTKEHFAIYFNCPTLRTFLSIGEVMFGNVIDFSQDVTDLTFDEVSNRKLSSGDTGLDFIPELTDGNKLTRYNFTFDHLLFENSADRTVKNFIMKLNRFEMPTVIVENVDGQDQTSHFAVLEDVSNNSPSNYRNNVQCKFLSPSYRAKSQAQTLDTDEIAYYTVAYESAPPLEIDTIYFMTVSARNIYGDIVLIDSETVVVFAPDVDVQFDYNGDGTYNAPEDLNVTLINGQITTRIRGLTDTTLGYSLSDASGISNDFTVEFQNTAPASQEYLRITVPDNGDTSITEGGNNNAIPASSYNIRFPNRYPAEVVAVGSGGAGYDDTIEVSDDYSLVP